MTVATPDHLHREIGVAAAQAGKHVLMEKPLALTVADCKAVIAATRAAGVKLMVDFHNRWSPPFNTMKQGIEAGDLGDPLLINARLNNTIFVPTEMLRWAGQSATIWFTGSHLIDIVTWLIGSEVTRVYSVSRSTVLAARGIPTPDFFETTLEFASGAVAVVENCWILPNSEPSIVDFKLRCVGSKGSAGVDTTHNRTLEMYGEQRHGYRDVLGMVDVFGQKRGFALESIHYFADCVINDRQPFAHRRGRLAQHRDDLRRARVRGTGMPVSV